MAEKRVVITGAEITAFGRLKNFKIELSDGFNVICGMNEAGKSTLLLFLKAMLYGIPGRRRSGELLKDRERAVPWGEKSASGVLFLRADGRNTEIRRKFGKTAAGDKIEAVNADSGDSIPELCVSNVGEVLLGVPEEVFGKTLMIAQSGAFMGGREDEISKRLMNLKSTGDEKVSAEAAAEKLNAFANTLKTGKGKRLPGRIDVLEERIASLRQEKYNLMTQLQQSENTRQRCEAAHAELEETESRIVACEAEYKAAIAYERAAAARERAARAEECERRLSELERNEAYIRGGELTEEICREAARLHEEAEFAAKAANAVQDECEAEAGRRQTKGVLCSTLGGAFAAAAAVMIVFMGISAVVPWIAAVIGVVLIASGIKFIQTSKNIRDTALSKRTESERRAEAAKRRLSEIFDRFGVSSVPELNNLYIKCRGIYERISALKASKAEFADVGQGEKIDVTESILPRSAEEVEEELKRLRGRQVELAGEIKGLESKMAYSVNMTRIPSDIDTEIKAAKEEISECEKQLAAAELAISVIRDTGDKWRSAFAPRLNQRVSEIMSRVSGRDRGRVRVSEDYMMSLTSDGEAYAAEYLSRGAYEQLYFSLRYAVADLICGGLPMLLDDILTVYDDERAEAALTFLSGETERQIFLFTCRKSEAKTAERLGANIIYI